MRVIQTASLLLLAVCLTNAAAVTIQQKDAPCTSPAQWEGRASEYDHIQGINNRFIISFDGKTKMKRFIEERKSYMPGKRWYEYIQDFEKGIQYKININDNICTVDKLNGRWQNHTIPTNATLEDKYAIGNADQEFSVTEWSDRVPGRKKEAWIGVFTDKTCWPVFEIFAYNDPESDYSVSTSTRFFDMTLGIKNINVFTPPAICTKAYQETIVNEVIVDEEFNTEYIDRFVEVFKKVFYFWSDWSY